MALVNIDRHGVASFFMTAFGIVLAAAAHVVPFLPPQYGQPLGLIVAGAGAIYAARSQPAVSAPVVLPPAPMPAAK